MLVSLGLNNVVISYKMKGEERKEQIAINSSSNDEETIRSWCALMKSISKTQKNIQEPDGRSRDEKKWKPKIYNSFDFRQTDHRMLAQKYANRSC